MKHILNTIVKTKNITSVAFTTDKDAQIAKTQLFDNWGLGAKLIVEDNSLIASLRHFTDNGVLSSEVFDSREEADVAQALMLKDWNIQTEVHLHEPEPVDQLLNFEEY